MRNRFLPINSTDPILTSFKEINMKGHQTRLVPLLVITVLISGIISLTSVYADEDAGVLQLNHDEYSISNYETFDLMISGSVEEYKKGAPLYLTISKPDGTTDAQKILVGKDGFKSVIMMFDRDSPRGVYEIEATYYEQSFPPVFFNLIDGSTEPSLESTHEPIYDEPIHPEPVFEEPIYDDEEIEIEVEIEDGIATIEAEFGDEELEFEIEWVDEQTTITEIAIRTGLSIDEIEGSITFEIDYDEAIYNEPVHDELVFDESFHDEPVYDERPDDSNHYTENEFYDDFGPLEDKFMKKFEQLHEEFEQKWMELDYDFDAKRMILDHEYQNQFQDLEQSFDEKRLAIEHEFRGQDRYDNEFNEQLDNLRDEFDEKRMSLEMQMRQEFYDLEDGFDQLRRQLDEEFEQKQMSIEREFDNERRQMEDEIRYEYEYEYRGMPDGYSEEIKNIEDAILEKFSMDEIMSYWMMGDREGLLSEILSRTDLTKEQVLTVFEYHEKFEQNQGDRHDDYPKNTDGRDYYSPEFRKGDHQEDSSEIQNLEQRIQELEQENSDLRDYVEELGKKLEGLNEVVISQVQVIYDWILGQ